jgi:hypothetical protein
VADSGYDEWSPELAGTWMGQAVAPADVNRRGVRRPTGVQIWMPTTFSVLIKQSPSFLAH